MRKLSLLALTLGCTVAPAQPEVPELSWSPDTVSVVPRIIRVRDDSTREFEFMRPVSIRADSGLAVVADAGDDRIFVIDSAGAVVQRFGTRGRGPGELYGVSHLVLRHAHVLVGDAHNGRISEFAFDGNFVRTYQSPFAAGAIGATSDHVFSASRSSTHYAIIARPDSLPVDALRRPPLSLSRNVRNRWPTLPGHDLIVSDSTRTWVFDQGGGLICEYEAAQSPPHCARLPLNLLERLQRYRSDRVARLEKAIRMRVDAAPLAKDFLLAGPWLALLLPLPELPVVLINPTDGTLTPVAMFGPLPDWARSARSFAWDGRAFLLVGDDGIGRLDISTAHSAFR